MGFWSMEYGVWSMEYGVWSMEYGVWSMEYGVWSMELEALTSFSLIVNSYFFSKQSAWHHQKSKNDTYF
jgi:hypothetical protein